MCGVFIFFQRAVVGRVEAIASIIKVAVAVGQAIRKCAVRMPRLVALVRHSSSVDCPLPPTTSLTAQSLECKVMVLMAMVVSGISVRVQQASTAGGRGTTLHSPSES